MKILESVKKNLKSIELYADKPRFHRMQLLLILECFLAIVLKCLHLVYDANTEKEYMYSILMTTFGILVFIAYLSTIFQTTAIYDFIDQLETIVNESKFNFMLSKRSDALMI